MGRVLHVAWAALLLALLVPAPVAAGVLGASADFDYTYSQEHVGVDVGAEVKFSQKYEIRYETSLTTMFDFLGAVRLDISDSWYTDAATTSQVAPSLELQVKGSQAAAKLTYETTYSRTDEFEESGESETFASSLSLDFELTPALWPEIKLSYQHQSDREPFATESTTDSLEFQARKDIYNLRLEFNLSHEEGRQVLPETTDSESTTWSARATYQEILWGDVEFGLSYEINESQSEENVRGVFSSYSKDYTQLFKTKLKKSFVVGPRVLGALSWDYEFEQDLLQVEYDYKYTNSYQLDLRWDFSDRLKFAGSAGRETSHTEALEGFEDENTVNDTVKLGFDYEPVYWLRLGGKAEFTWDRAVAADSGASVDESSSEKYELVAKHLWSSFWDLTLNLTHDVEREEDWVVGRTSKFKADLKLKWEDLVVSPSYEISRQTDWEWGYADPAGQSRTQDAKIQFGYRWDWEHFFVLTFTHEYGVKLEESLDETASYDRTLQFNESTEISVALFEFYRDLLLKGSVKRDASDTEDDPDPQVIDVAYTLDLGWKYEDVVLASSLKYNDKGDAFDDLSFNTKVGWRYERLELTGEYQFDKVYAESIEENRKVNLKLNYKF